MRLSHVPGTEGEATVRDELFLIAWGLAMLGGALLYAATGWPMPLLIDKAMPAASDAARR